MLPPLARMSARIAAARRALCASASGPGSGIVTGLMPRRIAGRLQTGPDLPRWGMSEATAPPVALVTGAARRVGAQISRTLHAAGYDLALHYRHSADEVAVLQRELEAARPHSTLALSAELSEVARLPLLVNDVLARFGRLDALVNNASSFRPTPIGSATEADWDDLFASNAKAPFFLSQAAAPHLRASGGAIVNLVD